MFIFMWRFIYRSRRGCLNSLMTKKREHLRLKIEAVHFRAKQNSVERYDRIAD